MKNAIRNMLLTANLIFTFLVATPAAAENGRGMQPLQAHTITMTDYTAVVYYTRNDKNDYQIVTTVGPNIGVNGETVQHRVTIKPGQSYELSMNSGLAGNAINVIQFTACDDGLITANL